MQKFTKDYSTRKTSQRQKIPGSSQVKNSAGGFSFQVDDWTRLDRFLILGTEGGSYYASQSKLTVENAEAVRRCIQMDGKRVVRTIVEISDQGRAAKNDPAIFALAMCAKLGDLSTRREALAALPKVCRIGTHLFHFAEYAKGFGGWGRGMRDAVAGWYNARPADKLAYQLVKYQQRDGWSHRDLLRKCHAKPVDSMHGLLFQWTTKGELDEVAQGAIPLIDAFERAKSADKRELIKLITEFNLPREAVPTQFLKDADVWNALLQRMPLTAMIRNLGNMSKVGLLKPMSNASKHIVACLSDKEKLQKARIHPIAVLAALKVYESGRGVRGSGSWQPVAKVVDALDGAFYKTFKNVEPAGKRTLLALDVSGSMDCGEIAGMPGITPRVGSAAMALVTAATEKDHQFVSFSCKGSRRGWGWGRADQSNPDEGIQALSITPKMRLDSVIKRVSGLPFGGTDCALPMLWAIKHKVEVDTFCIYTDSETWAGSIHPSQALTAYRQQTGIPAKLVVVGMVSNQFTIADPNDAGMMDVVGFDTGTPALISDFSRQ